MSAASAATEEKTAGGEAEGGDVSNEALLDSSIRVHKFLISYGRLLKKCRVTASLWRLGRPNCRSLKMPKRSM